MEMKRFRANGLAETRFPYGAELPLGRDWRSNQRLLVGNGLEFEEKDGRIKRNASASY
jgi:hypothetical protein